MRYWIPALCLLLPYCTSSKSHERYTWGASRGEVLEALAEEIGRGVIEVEREGRLIVRNVNLMGFPCKKMFLSPSGKLDGILYMCENLGPMTNDLSTKLTRQFQKDYGEGRIQTFQLTGKPVEYSVWKAKSTKVYLAQNRQRGYLLVVYSNQELPDFYRSLLELQGVTGDTI